MPKYNYLDRDLQLPVQIHQNAQSYRDSPDEGTQVHKVHIYLPTDLVIIANRFRNLHPEVPGQQHLDGEPDLGEPPLPPVRSATPAVSSAPQLNAIPSGSHYPDARRIPHSAASGNCHFVEGNRWILSGSGHVLGCGGSHNKSHSVAQGAESPHDQETVCPASLSQMVITTIAALIKQLNPHPTICSISFAVVMPFYSASLVETVQSDIASEKPGFLDVFREGGLRLLYWSAPQKGRMLPVWVLLGPSIALGMSKYVFG